MSQVLPEERRLAFSTQLPKRRILVNPGAIIFWTMFALTYLYLSRLLVVVTYGRFRLGAFALGLGFLSVLLHGRMVKNIGLALVSILLCFVALLSAWINRSSLLQLAAFVRIPVAAYLIYHLVKYFLNTEARARQVLRCMYTIAVLQLPVVALQRWTYPWLPERLKFGSLTGELSLVDFGMGTFSGDTSMAFALIGLIILLLFAPYTHSVVKRKWLMSGWLSVTVLFSNSQIQHITILLVWGGYLISHLKVRTIVVSILVLVVVTGALVILHQSGVMTFPPLSHTLARLSKLSLIVERNVREEQFLEGGHAREAAIHYYLQQPMKWIGEGPGSAYNTVTGERTIGSWGHAFTFYAEVGLVGWLLSILAFLVMASPARFVSAGVLRFSWVGFLMFIAVNIVTFVKYPMGDSALMFTYCVVLIGHRVLAASRLKTSRQI